MKIGIRIMSESAFPRAGNCKMLRGRQKGMASIFKLAIPFCRFLNFYPMEELF